jgi:hypothetical protein
MVPNPRSLLTIVRREVLVKDAEAVKVTTDGLEMLAMWCRNISMLPLEEWQEAFNKAETVAPLLDPTLYREYISSGKSQVIKELIRLAIPLKHAVLKAQSTLKANSDASSKLNVSEPCEHVPTPENDPQPPLTGGLKRFE